MAYPHCEISSLAFGLSVRVNEAAFPNPVLLNVNQNMYFSFYVVAWNSVAPFGRKLKLRFVTIHFIFFQFHYCFAIL